MPEHRQPGSVIDVAAERISNVVRRDGSRDWEHLWDKKEDHLEWLEKLVTETGAKLREDVKTPSGKVRKGRGVGLSLKEYTKRTLFIKGMMKRSLTSDYENEMAAWKKVYEDMRERLIHNYLDGFEEGVEWVKKLGHSPSADEIKGEKEELEKKLRGPSGDGREKHDSY